MTIIKILNDAEINKFDSIPELTDQQRQDYLQPLQADLNEGYFRKPTTAVGFIILRGYFLACGKFFHPRKFSKNDIEFVCKKLKVEAIVSLENNYPKSTYNYHKQIIAKHFGFTAFNEWRTHFQSETNELVKTSLKPKQIFYYLTKLLHEKKIEVPSYFVIAKSITNALNSFETRLSTKIDELLSSDQKEYLDAVMTITESDDEKISPQNAYLLTILKKPLQATSPSKINESLKHFDFINEIYVEFSDVLRGLALTDQLLNYYAVWMIKSKHTSFLSISDKSKQYLYLLSLIVYQYRIRQDLFVDTFLKAVQRHEGESIKAIKNDFLNERPTKNKQVRKILGLVMTTSQQIENIKEITYAAAYSDSVKISQMKEMFTELNINGGRDQIKEELENLEKSISSNLKEQMQAEQNISRCRKLQNRVGKILRILEFNSATSDKNIIEAIQYYKYHEGKVKKDAPLDFLSPKDLKTLESFEGTIRFSLYKVYLFIEVADRIKAGSLNLVNSDKYRAIEEYLITDKEWNESKDLLLKRANLSIDAKFDDYLPKIKKQLFLQYKKTNERASSNEYLSFTKKGRPKVNTPKVEKPETERISALLESDNILPLQQILSDVNNSSEFLSAFTHFSKKNHQSTPSSEVFFAAIMALGCNLGVSKMGKISKGISAEKLNYIVQWYFSKENLDDASNKLMESIGKLSLPTIFKKNPDSMHTSSDGQKFNVTVPSIHASHSFKYFGTGKGVTSYSFVDEYSRLFYNTVISASEREAAYVIDGLMHNEDVESEIHSTDTHGYSEIIFALTNGLGVFFSPRIKNYSDQSFYTFKESTRKKYENIGYSVLPTKGMYINERNLSNQWDTILRLIVSIKLRETTASRVLKRLSSYSKEHPLYIALKELGRIYKSIFLLKYIDEVTLRQSTEKVLNRGEQSHQFAKAISFGNNQELKYGTKEAQEIAIGARQVIQNVIVLWNYLKLSESLALCESEDLFNDTLNIIENSSIMTWQHINMHGEYDFDLLEFSTSKPFLMEKIMALQLN